MIAELKGSIKIDNQQFRSAVYEGAIFRLPSTRASLMLRWEAERLVQAHLGCEYRKAQFVMERERFFQRLTEAKRAVFESQRIRSIIRRMLVAYGFSPFENAFDPPRFRAVTHGGHTARQAAVAYMAHRDTWYANPQAQINWWMPLHDVGEEETFCFYPAYFSKSIANDSERFDYDQWIAAVGFGRSQTAGAAFYPGPTRRDAIAQTRDVLKFSCRKGQIIVFSAAHLHRTLENSSGLTRCSLDFRTVHLNDAISGIGAPNVDNRSSGTSLKDYLHPSGFREVAACLPTISA